MSRARPEEGCHEVAFEPPVPLDEGAEVALEDYARTLTRARAAEAVRADALPAAVRAVHVCGLEGPPAAAARRDLEDFARSMVTGTGGGLGWS
jgi:hypothetical protein